MARKERELTHIRHDERFVHIKMHHYFYHPELYFKIVKVFTDYLGGENWAEDLRCVFPSYSPFAYGTNFKNHIPVNSVAHLAYILYRLDKAGIIDDKRWFERKRIDGKLRRVLVGKEVSRNSHHSWWQDIIEVNESFEYNGRVVSAGQLKRAKQKAIDRYEYFHNQVEALKYGKTYSKIAQDMDEIEALFKAMVLSKNAKWVVSKETVGQWDELMRISRNAFEPCDIIHNIECEEEC